MTWQIISGRPYAEDPRDIVHDRYVVGRVIGRGSFGQVIVAYDLVADRHVALKVIKRSETFYKQALKERRCKLTASKPVLKAAMVSALETII